MSDDLEERLRSSLLELPGSTAQAQAVGRERALMGAAEAREAESAGRWRSLLRHASARSLGVVASRRSLALVLATALPTLVLGAVLGVLVWPGATAGQTSPFPGPTFTPAEGWTSVVSAVFPSNAEYAPSAWATNVSISGNPFATPLNEGPLRDLPAGGIVIAASDLGLLPAATGEHTYVDRELPLQISDAQIQSRWLGQPNDNIPQYVLLARVKQQWIDVRIYFGTQQPSQRMLDTAQSELDRLQIPNPNLLAG